MPFASASANSSPLFKVEVDSMEHVDTRNVENFYRLWSVFSRCASTLEHGKRFENLCWRAWSRETFCCAAEASTVTPQSQWKKKKKNGNINRASFASPASSGATPSSLSSYASVSSDAASDTSSSDAESASNKLNSTTGASSSSLIPPKPQVRRLDSDQSHTKNKAKGSEKHMTAIDLKQIVVSIKENKELEKLPPLPPTLTVRKPTARSTTPPALLLHSTCDTTPKPSSPSYCMAPDSSTSTVATTYSASSHDRSPQPDSQASVSTEATSHSVVRGFTLGRISSATRSSSNLAPTRPPPILKNAPAVKTIYSKHIHASGKGATFTLGGPSSGEEHESSLDSRYGGTVKRPASEKATATDVVVNSRAYESEEVFESDFEDEFGSADDWEDEDEPSRPPSVNEFDMFKRVDSRVNLVSRRSLLTAAFHEPDRAAQIQNAASRSAPAIRRSRTSTPNGPSLACSPKEGAEFPLPGQPGPGDFRARPVNLTTSTSTQPPGAMSPRTTRRNMLHGEMTESLRKNLLWERQVKNATANAHLKRCHTYNEFENLSHNPSENKLRIPGRLATIQDHQATSSWNKNHFDYGLLEYHEKGW